MLTAVVEGVCLLLLLLLLSLLLCFLSLAPALTAVSLLLTVHHVAVAVGAALGAAPAGIPVLLQLTEGQLQITELTAHQPLRTLLRLHRAHTQAITAADSERSTNLTIR